MSIEIQEKRYASAHGYSGANIFFLAGFPFKDDIKNGVALSGGMENQLNGFLRDASLALQLNVTITQCYRSCFIKEPLDYSGTNPKKLRNALNKVDVKNYEQLLFTEIYEVNPNIIVPLDDLALAAVFPHINSIKKPKGRKYWVNCYRGSILPIREDWQVKLKDYVRVIPTLSPQLLYSDYTARSYVNLDYRRILQNRLNRVPIKDYGIVWVAKTARAFENFLSRSWANKPKLLVFDIETYGGIPTCISFSFDGFEACTVPLFDFAISRSEMIFLWRLVAATLASDIPKGNQNIKYDVTILTRFGFIVKNIREDSMIKGGLIYPELPRGLDFYTSIYTPIPYYKDEGKEFNPKIHSRDRLYLYCSKDSQAAWLSIDEQEKEL